MRGRPSLVQGLPVGVKQQDPLLGAQICKRFGPTWFYGRVVDIELDEATGDLAYLIEYDDGDAEHLSEDGVRAHLWRLQHAPRRRSFAQTPPRSPGSEAGEMPDVSMSEVFFGLLKVVVIIGVIGGCLWTWSGGLSVDVSSDLQLPGNDEHRTIESEPVLVGSSFEPLELTSHSEQPQGALGLDPNSPGRSAEAVDTPSQMDLDEHAPVSDPWEAPHIQHSFDWTTVPPSGDVLPRVAEDMNEAAGHQGNFETPLLYDKPTEELPSGSVEVFVVSALVLYMSACCCIMEKQGAGGAIGADSNGSVMPGLHASSPHDAVLASSSIALPSRPSDAGHTASSSSHIPTDSTMLPWPTPVPSMAVPTDVYWEVPSAPLSSLPTPASLASRLSPPAPHKARARFPSLAAEAQIMASPVAVATPARSSALPTEAPAELGALAARRKDAPSRASPRRSGLVSPSRFRYSMSLAQMKDMGFHDSADLREALTYCQGRVPDAIRRLCDA